MAYQRIVVPLTAEERDILLQIAEVECRDPREQMHFLLRKEAQQRGLLGHADAIGIAVSELDGNGDPKTTQTIGVASPAQHTEHSDTST